MSILLTFLSFNGAGRETMIHAWSRSVAPGRKGLPWVFVIRSAGLGILGLLMLKICLRVTHPGGQPTEGMQLFSTEGNLADQAELEKGFSDGNGATKYSPLRSKVIKKTAAYKETSDERPMELPKRIKMVVKPRTASDVEAFLKSEERAYLGRHALWDEKKGSPRLASLQEARGTLLPWEGDTVDAIEEIKALQATYPPGQPKGCVVMMLDPVHCGKACVDSPSTQRGCTQVRSARGLLRDLSRGVMGRRGYPAVVLHVDLSELDMDELREAYYPSLVLFQRVVMEEAALPVYADAKALLPWLRSKHPGGDLTLPPSEPGFRGFGARMHSRLFAGLLPHTPLMQPFDFYLRLEPEAGVVDLARDPFEDMAHRGKAYLYPGAHLSGGDRLGLLMSPATYEYLWTIHPEVHPDPRTFCKAMDCEEETYRGTRFDTHIELVHMTPLRSVEYWDFFLHVDRSNLFLCNYDSVGRSCRTAGDIGEAGETVGDGLSTVGTMTLAEFRERRREKRRRREGKAVDGQTFENTAIGDGDFKAVALALVLDSSRMEQIGGSVYRYPRPEPCRGAQWDGEEEQERAEARVQ